MSSPASAAAFKILGRGPTRIGAISPARAASVASGPSASDAASGTQIASAARIISGHGGATGFGRTTSASQSGTTAAVIAAARVLIRAGLRLTLSRRHASVYFLPNGPDASPSRP